jgi:hypothetical protein
MLEGIDIFPPLHPLGDVRMRPGKAV